jgi:hypothetical protein
VPRASPGAAVAESYHHSHDAWNQCHPLGDNIQISMGVCIDDIIVAMKPYRFNPFIDSLRLIRGILFNNQIDPYIETHPPRILSRKQLFKFSDIQNESGKYQFTYKGYDPYISPQPLLMKHLPAQYGRHAFQHLIQNKAERIHQIAQLLEQYKIHIEATQACWSGIGNWVLEQIEPNREPAHISEHTDAALIGELRLRPLWYSILTDLSLLLGEHLISLDDRFSWQFWADVDYPGLDHSIWILCEPVPISGKWKHTPSVILPFDVLCISAGSMLKKKQNGTQVIHDENFGWGLMFRQHLNISDKQIQAPLVDSLVSDFVTFFEEAKLMQCDTTHDTSGEEALDIFLKSYIDQFGHLPSTADLTCLESICGRLPDWVRYYSDTQT